MHKIVNFVALSLALMSASTFANTQSVCGKVKKIQTYMEPSIGEGLTAKIERSDGSTLEAKVFGAVSASILVNAFDRKKKICLNQYVGAGDFYFGAELE